MSVSVQCECGKKLRVAEPSAAKRYKCPGCGKALAIPGAKPPAGREPAAPKPVVASGHAAPRAPAQSGDRSLVTLAPAADVRSVFAPHLEAVYQPSGRTTPRALLFMGAAMVPAILAGTLAFLLIMLLAWLIGGWLSGLVDMLIWPAFGEVSEIWNDPGWVNRRLSKMLLMIVVAIFLAIVRWFLYLAVPMAVLLGPVLMGTIVGRTVARAGTAGNNRNTVIPISLAALASVVALLLATALIFPNITEPVLGPASWADGWLFVRLDKLLFFTPLAWIAVGLGLVLSITAAVMTSRRIVLESPCCETCGPCCQTTVSPPVWIGPQLIASIVDARAFAFLGRLPWVSRIEGTHYRVKLHRCPECGEGLLAATTEDPVAHDFDTLGEQELGAGLRSLALLWIALSSGRLSWSRAFRSIAIDRSEGEQVLAALERGSPGKAGEARANRGTESAEEAADTGRLFDHMRRERNEQAVSVLASVIDIPSTGAQNLLALLELLTERGARGLAKFFHEADKEEWVAFAIRLGASSAEDLAERRKASGLAPIPDADMRLPDTSDLARLAAALNDGRGADAFFRS